MCQINLMKKRHFQLSTGKIRPTYTNSYPYSYLMLHTKINLKMIRDINLYIQHIIYIKQKTICDNKICLNMIPKTSTIKEKN